MWRGPTASPRPVQKGPARSPGGPCQPPSAQQLAQLEFDSSGTVALLERMKEKIATEESLAESYGQIVQESRTIDQ